MDVKDIRKLINGMPRSVAYEWIATGKIEEENINKAKALLLNKYAEVVEEIDGLDPVDLAIMNYVYTTSVGKEAAEAKRRLRQKLIHKVAFQKDNRPHLFDEDGGLHYSRWCSLWAKEQERHFSIFFGKDPRLWLSKIQEKYELDRSQAERDGII